MENRRIYGSLKMKERGGGQEFMANSENFDMQKGKGTLAYDLTKTDSKKENTKFCKGKNWDI